MASLVESVGRRTLNLFDYVGAPDAERVLVIDFNRSNFSPLRSMRKRPA